MKIKIAASTYLNSAPLVYGFTHGQQQQLCQFLGDAAPARCADLLAARAVHAALIPSIEYQRISDIRALPAMAVAAKQTVRSVVLAARRPIAELRSIALDTSSRTSAALVRILLDRFYGIKPQYVNFSPSLVDMLELHDGALIIGDPAMTVDRNAYFVYDLAEEWRRATGLPFVFAIWAVAESAIGAVEKSAIGAVEKCAVGAVEKSAVGAVDSAMEADKAATASDFVTIFAQAKSAGLAARGEIAEAYSARLGLPAASLLEYLTENINYDLDEENLAGLQRFYQLAAESGLIEAVRPLKFL
jgi:chorismate dehydratase